LQIASGGTSRDTGFLCYPGRLSSAYPIRVSKYELDISCAVRNPSIFASTLSKTLQHRSFYGLGVLRISKSFEVDWQVTSFCHCRRNRNTGRRDGFAGKNLL